MASEKNAKSFNGSNTSPQSSASRSIALEGSWHGYLSERVNLYKFQREIAEDGVSYGFKIEVNAHVDCIPREFRYLVTGLGACVSYA